jgi:arylsulfatase A-like enzyme
MSRVLVLGMLLLSFVSSVTFTQAAEQRPNIVWFIVDDMSANYSCYGEKLIQTPVVDGLAARGVRFANAFVTAPVCSPCRSALITGMYQTTIGSHHHRSGRGVEKINLPDGVQPIPELMQAAGYFTCIGDGLNLKAKGKGKTDYNFEYSPKIYNSHDWSDRQANQPFFMQVQLSGGKLREGKNWSMNAQQQLGKLTDPQQVVLPEYYPRDPVLLNDWAAYLDTCRMTDQHVGKVLERLKSEGLLDNTVVIFMTDHGISHARGKQFLYNEGTHVPLVIAGPGIPSGKVRDDLVEHIDLAAITLRLAGLKLPAKMQGKDTLAADYKPRTAVYAARDRCDETVEHLRSVRTEKYLYIKNYLWQRPHLQPNNYKDNKAIVRRLRELHDAKQLNSLQEKLLFAPQRPREELYLWRTDTQQLTNLADDPAYQTALLEHRQMLTTWETETNDQGRQPESASRYESDMKVYLGGKNPDSTIQKNIDLMKRWASEGK